MVGLFGDKLVGPDGARSCGRNNNPLFLCCPFSWPLMDSFFLRISGYLSKLNLLTSESTFCLLDYISKNILHSSIRWQVQEFVAAWFLAVGPGGNHFLTLGVWMGKMWIYIMEHETEATKCVWYNNINGPLKKYVVGKRKKKQFICTEDVL